MPSEEDRIKSGTLGVSVSEDVPSLGISGSPQVSGLGELPVDVARGEERSARTALRRRLPVMPLAVLLPQCGNVAVLGSYLVSLEERFQEVQNSNRSLGANSPKESLSEESMLNQVLHWLKGTESSFTNRESAEGVTARYSSEQAAAIYELGKMYYEMGYFVPAERIFNGLVTIELLSQAASTPSFKAKATDAAYLGLGVLKLERGLYQESTLHFRELVDSAQYATYAKLGLCAAFIGLGEYPRARSVLGQIETETRALSSNEPEIVSLWEAFAIRCGG